MATTTARSLCPQRRAFCSAGSLPVQGVGNLKAGFLSSSVRTLRWKRSEHREACRAILQEDAPYAIAIGACICSTLLLPVVEGKPEGSVLGPDDVRYAAMGIISFIPLFDWLAWVFAWLDTSRRRYLIYSIVYLAPYLKSGLSISTDDSWLPLASVLACIVHVQLEIAVNNQGLEEAKLKENITKMLFEKTRVKELRERSTGLLSRLQNLAERSGHSEKPAGSKSEGADDEFETWDEKFLDNLKNSDKIKEEGTKAKEQ